MGTDLPAAPRPEARHWPTDARPSPDCRWHALGRGNWCPLARAAAGVRAVADGLQPLSPLAHGRHLAAHHRRVPPAARQSTMLTVAVVLVAVAKQREYRLGGCLEGDRLVVGSCRHLGWGVIASNLHHIGHHLAAKAAA